MEKKSMTKFEMPKMVKSDQYQTASFEHCHQVKECDPYPAKA